jgi:hypothetical protein
MPPLKPNSPRTEKISLPDTKTDFPELPQASDSSVSSASPSAFTIKSAEEDSSTLEMQIPAADDWRRHLRPTLLLLIIPVTLIAGALLAWGFIKLLH